jgi:hypothetical protein
MEVKKTGLTVTGSSVKKPQIPQVSNIWHPSPQLSFCCFCFCPQAKLLAALWQHEVRVTGAADFIIPENEDKKTIHKICTAAKNFTHQKYLNYCGFLKKINAPSNLLLGGIQPKPYHN